MTYLTPFAWGGCGLILPRYPGTRVALAYRNGAPDDPVEVGALWPTGHAPVSQPGTGGCPCRSGWPATAARRSATRWCPPTTTARWRTT
ncbi:hypothetical protein NKG94_11055 [Micromonospora sp. M12]